ncbi:hypothetical protein IJE86_07960 [bacterium]|nr:hypothetical protein [bacterium]
MQVGDVFYSVMQKDNCPFEKPRITKFVIDKIFTANCTHPIVATKTDKWGRHYCFKESQVYSTYEDAIPEKNEKLEKIRQWEKDRQEWNAKIFEEQRKREDLEKKQIAIDVLKDLKKYACLKICFVSLDEQYRFYDYIDNKIKELKGG